MGELNFISSNKRKRDALKNIKNRRFDYTEQELADANSFFDKKEKELVNEITKEYIKQYGVGPDGVFENEEDARASAISDASQKIYDNIRSNYLSKDNDFLELENADFLSGARNVKNTLLGAAIGSGATFALMHKKPKLKKSFKENFGGNPYIFGGILGGASGFGLSRATDAYRKETQDALRKIENQAYIDAYRNETKRTQKVAFYKGEIEKIAKEKREEPFVSKYKAPIALGAGALTAGTIAYLANKKSKKQANDMINQMLDIRKSIKSVPYEVSEVAGEVKKKQLQKTKIKPNPDSTGKIFLVNKDGTKRIEVPIREAFENPLYKNWHMEL